jgi:hypothetical protein
VRQAEARVDRAGGHDPVALHGERRDVVGTVPKSVIALPPAPNAASGAPAEV